MVQFFYDFISFQYFPIILGVWIFVCVTWVERWKSLLSRLQKIASKPIIFKTDPNPDDVPFYPRRFMETLANRKSSALKYPFTDLIRVFTSWLDQLILLVYSKEHPYRIVGLVFISGSFLFFIFADAVSVANTLVVLELLPSNLPKLLSRFDLAVAVGSLFAFVVCTVMFFEIQSNEGEFSNWATRDKQTKSLALGIASLTIALSLISLVSWSLFNLIQVGIVNSTPMLDGILNWVLYGLAPINSALAAALTYTDALRGLIVVIIFIFWIIIIALYIMNYLAATLSFILPYIFDIVWRLIFSLFDIAQWFISTPIQATLLPLRLITSVFSIDENAETRSNKY